MTGVLFLVGCNPLCLDSPCDLSVRHRVSAACIAPHGYFLRSAVSHPMNIQGCYDLKTHRPPDMGYGNSNLIYQCFISSSRLVAHALQSIRANRCMGPMGSELPLFAGIPGAEVTRSDGAASLLEQCLVGWLFFFWRFYTALGNALSRRL